MMAKVIVHYAIKTSKVTNNFTVTESDCKYIFDYAQYTCKFRVQVVTICIGFSLHSNVVITNDKCTTVPTSKVVFCLYIILYIVFFCTDTVSDKRLLRTNPTKVS